jgi:putative isomerase
LNLLVWISLSHETYHDVPRVAAARKGLCRQAHAALMVEWRSKRHVHENLNATTAEGCDVENSNPFYHWGANSGYIAMREAMADPAFAASIPQ